MRQLSELQLIAAVDHSGGIASKGEIPWNYKEDWAHFKSVTKDSICIMGRKTAEDIAARSKTKNPKNLLPKRESYVISSQQGLAIPGAVGVAPSLRRVVDNITNSKPMFILGGEKLYIQSIVWANVVHLTIVPGYHNCDRFFPITYLSKYFTILNGREEGELKFLTYKRKQ